MNQQALLYGVLFSIAGLVSALVTMNNKKKNKGTLLTTIIAIVGFVGAVFELIAGVM